MIKLLCLILSLAFINVAFSAPVCCRNCGGNQVLSTEEQTVLEVNDELAEEVELLSRTDNCRDRFVCEQKCDSIVTGCKSIAWFDIGKIANYPTHYPNGLPTHESHLYESTCGVRQKDSLYHLYLNQAKRLNAPVKFSQGAPYIDGAWSSVFDPLWMYNNLLRLFEKKCITTPNWRNNAQAALSIWENGGTQKDNTGAYINAYNRYKAFSEIIPVDKRKIFEALRLESRKIFLKQLMDDNRSYCDCSSMKEYFNGMAKTHSGIYLTTEFNTFAKSFNDFQFSVSNECDKLCPKPRAPVESNEDNSEGEQEEGEEDY